MMFNNLLCLISFLVVSTCARALKSGIYRIENAVTHDVLLCGPDGKVLPFPSPAYHPATFWKVAVTEEEPDVFTVSPIVQDDKLLSFADDNGHPGNDVVVAPGDPFYPALQWRISGRDEEGLWIENRLFRYTHIGQDLGNRRIVAQAADWESPNQLWRFVLVNWVAAEHQDNVQVPTSLVPGYYRIKPLIEDTLALVAGTDRKVRVLHPDAPGSIFPPVWFVRPVGPGTFTVAPMTQPRELLAFGDDNIPGVDVVIRPDDPNNSRVQWLLRSSEDNDGAFSIINTYLYGMSLGFNPYNGKVEAARAEQDNPTQLWIFEPLNSLVEEETSQEDSLAVESKAQFFDLFSELAAFITARI
ncbi:hypothetical protein ARMSODRAFT_947577 [Armillaria solidipes]|uniref:Ricin B lectin domain-containing protein n=1 Tax=Armillaria solidipes TaxID=1076256 RepID=A0A2H3CJP0_9AGAR|nr:hypothetical protein ARMSODRAFT_947577 [Armillaria solidipes]